MKHIKRSLCMIMAVLIICMAAGCGGQTAEKKDGVRSAVSQWLIETVSEPVSGSVGGEWTVFGLARADVSVPEGYYEGYYERLETFAQQCGGVLHDRKYTEYSRVILALTAIGKDPTAVAGFNLLTPLANYERTIFQGINGPIFALLALDSGNYEIPAVSDGGTQATREMYVDYLLSMEAPEGGWSLAGGPAEADMTAMALQALAKYRDNEEVVDAVERGIETLSKLQDENGGFSAFGEDSCESVAQVIVALTELGIEIKDARFVKSGKTLEDRLMEFRREDGGFCHDMTSGVSDLMATEQAHYALVALERAEQGKTSLYTMTN